MTNEERARNILEELNQEPIKDTRKQNKEMQNEVQQPVQQGMGGPGPG